MVTVLAVALAEEAEHLRVADGERLLITGPGKVRSATALASYLAGDEGGEVELVVNLGTAGALVPHLAGVLEPRHVVEHDFDAATIEALVGRAFPVPTHLDGSPDDAELTLATGDRFLADARSANRLRDRGIHLVDMEAAALQAACSHHGVPLRVVKCVSDMADADAFRSWRESVSWASAQLGAWLERNRGQLHQSAP